MSSGINQSVEWDPSFAPSYTPEAMLKLGVFEGKYINAIEGVSEAWKKLPKVLKKDDEPNPEINHYGVKSRQPLSAWKSNGWIKTDKSGWFEWYIHYANGRRLGKEDDWQIGRWRSFVARHQGQINADSKSKNKDARLAQKQGLLQWAWDWETKFTDEQLEKNLKKLGVKIKKEESTKVVKEAIYPVYGRW